MQSLLLPRTILFHPGLRLSQRCKRSHMNCHPCLTLWLAVCRQMRATCTRFDVVTNFVPQSTGVGTRAGLQSASHEARLLPLHVPLISPLQLHVTCWPVLGVQSSSPTSSQLRSGRLCTIHIVRSLKRRVRILTTCLAICRS